MALGETAWKNLPRITPKGNVGFGIAVLFVPIETESDLL
jgi:hypothetical protein